MSTLEKKFSITYVGDNVPLVEPFKRYRKEEAHFNIPWALGFRRIHDSVCISLHCLNPFKDDKPWLINTKMEFELLSENESSISSSFKRPFSNSAYEKNEAWFHNYFVKWDCLKKYFMVDDKVTFKVNVTILEMKGFPRSKIRNFDDSKFSDVILRVGNQRFHVLKEYLACHSIYFKKLLMEGFKEAEQSEVVLKDVDVEDFQSFLELIHGESSVDEENIEGVLHLADMYDSPTAIRRCEEFLLEKSELELTEKLRFFSKYNCQVLKETILSRVTTKSEIDKILSDDICNMDPSIAVVLLQKKLEKAERPKKEAVKKKASIFSCFRNA